MSTSLASIEWKFIERNKSRHGTMRYYFRVDGKRVARLPNNPDTQEFALAYWAERKKLDHGSDEPIPVALPGRPLPNSFHALCVAYLVSEDYRRLDATTQTKRRQIIDSMLLEPLSKDDPRIFANMPIRAITVENLEVLRDRKRDTPFAADERLKILRQVFDTTRPGTSGRPESIVKTNIARLVKPFRKKTDGHHTITDDELAQYIRHHGIKSKAVLALVIMMFTGVRVSDLSLIGPQHRRSNKLVFRVFKNRNRSPVTLELEIHPILDMVLAWHPVKGMAYMMTEHNKLYTVKGMSNRVSQWFDQAKLHHCTAHSVRKGLATSLAESEATDSMLDGMFGWKDGKTSKIYTARKQQSKLARQAVQRIDWGEIENILPHPEKAVEFQNLSGQEKTS